MQIPKQISLELYQGDCLHKDLNNKLGGYGFRGAWGMKGVGMYWQCSDCGACSYSPDFEVSTEEEINHYNESPFSDGWVIVRN